MSPIDDIAEVWIYVHKFESEDQALAYAIRNQRDRRNLTGADIVGCVEALDKRR